MTGTANTGISGSTEDPHGTLTDLGRQTGALTPGALSSLRTAITSAVLLTPLVTVLTTPSRPWGVTVLALVMGGVGLLLAAVALIEIIPAPGRLTFHEHGFADARPDHTTDLYLDGSSVVHTLPDETPAPPAPAMRTPPTSPVTAR
ncbi:MAG: hypothetical protein ABI083_00065 [Lapillicoccus sp.]